jgi:polysaccharide biosynthesis protein PslG
MTLFTSYRGKTGTKPALPLLFITTVIFLAIMAACNASQPTPTATSTPLPHYTDLGKDQIKVKAYPSLSYGIHAFLWWNPTQRSFDLERVRQLRFGYVKQIIQWDDIQPDKDSVKDWAKLDSIVGEMEYRGLKLIARIGRAPYWTLRDKINSSDEPPYDLTAIETWCHTLAERYKGRIAGYQVWNEPNLAREWNNQTPNPAAYVKLLAACYKGIKASDPAGIVISAPLAPTGNDDSNAMSDTRYLHSMFDNGFSNYYDVLGLNAPGYKSSPETPPDDPSLNGNRWQVFRHVEDMREIQVGRGDGGKQIALLEVGWTTDTRKTVNDSNGTAIPNPYLWHAVSEPQQADYLVRAYEYAGKNWQPFVGLMVTIYLPDRSWTKDNEEYWWAIADAGAYHKSRNRQAYVDLANMAHYIDNVYYPPQDSWSHAYQPLPTYNPTGTPTP